MFKALEVEFERIRAYACLWRVSPSVPSWQESVRGSRMIDVGGAEMEHECEDELHANNHAYWDEDLNALCVSKVEEFTLLGYDNVSAEDVWKCVSSRYKLGLPALNQVVNDILSLKVNRFMNWAMMKAYKE